jgi:hypothetical protein
MYSGKDHVRQARKYAKYYGKSDISLYWSHKYDPTSPTAKGASWTKCWPEPIKIDGSDGGMFGIKRDKSDVLPVFITSLQRYFRLVYQKEVAYHGELPCYKYILDDKELQTSDKNPENAKWA